MKLANRLLKLPKEHKAVVLREEKSLLSSEQARSYLSGSAEACESRISDFNRKDNAI